MAQARVFFEGIPDSDWRPSEITYFRLFPQNDDQGVPECQVLTAVNRDGTPIDGGAVCAITRAGKLRVYKNVNPNILCALEPDGSIKVYS